MVSQRLHVIERQSWIQALQFAAKRGEHRLRITDRSSHERRIGVVVTQQGPIESRLGFFAQAVVFAVSSHADDFPVRLVGTAEVKAAADCVSTRQQAPRKSFIDYHHTRLIFIVALGKIATTQGNLHSAKIVGTNFIGNGQGQIAGDCC